MPRQHQTKNHRSKTPWSRVERAGVAATDVILLVPLRLEILAVRTSLACVRVRKRTAVEVGYRRIEHGRKDLAVGGEQGAMRRHADPRAARAQADQEVDVGELVRQVQSGQRVNQPRDHLSK